MTDVGDQIWMTENVTNKIAVISTDGGVTEIATPFTGATQPEQVVSDGAGNLWFTEPFAGKIGRVAPDGTRTDFAIPDPEQPADRHHARPGRRRLVHRIGGGQDRHDHA